MAKKFKKDNKAWNKDLKNEEKLLGKVNNFLEGFKYDKN